MIRYRKPNIRDFVDRAESEGMKAFKMTESKPYYLLTSKDLDIVIYYHQKFLKEMREDKLRAAAQEKGRPDNRQLFFTDVDIDQLENNQLETDVDDNKTLAREAKSVQSLRTRKGIAKGSLGRLSKAGLSKEKEEFWLKKKKGPKFLLDFRRNKPELLNTKEEQTEPLEKLKQIYSQFPQANRATYFVPKLKGPKNPQLAKIRAYFVNYTLLSQTAT